MKMVVEHIDASSILTRTSGYLASVSSHSLQPYIGCTFGHSLCGVGCYVQHHPFLTKGRQWGQFLTVKDNAARKYLETVDRESRWARRDGEFSIFMSSATDPFLPHEFKFRNTRSVLEAMLSVPPDVLIVQTHTHRVTRYASLLRQLANDCRLRVHLSIESDIDRLPGLPPPASSVEDRIVACDTLRQLGLSVVVTVAPVLPIKSPRQFFQRLSAVSDAIVIDHYIEGDGSVDGRRTKATALPRAIEVVNPQANRLAYRDHLVTIARSIKPGCVGVGIDGFAGRYLPA